MGFQGFSSSCKWPALVNHKCTKRWNGKACGVELKFYFLMDYCNVSFPDNRGTREDDFDQSSEATRGISVMEKMDSRTNNNNKHSSNAETQHSLRQEILLLEKKLQDQVSVRSALETALGYRISTHDISNENAIPKPVMELITEIAVLELEVGHLEQYLLLLYRKAFDQQLVSPSKNEAPKSASATPSARRLDFSKSMVTEKVANEPKYETLPNLRTEANGGSTEKFVDYTVQRSYSSLAKCLALTDKTSPDEALGKALRSCYSQPPSMMEYAQNASSHVISLAEHLGTRISDHIPETPNRLSEEMVKCMVNIYCKISDPPLTNRDLSSPTSSLSPTSAFSPVHHHDLSSSGYKIDSSLDFQLDSPFHVEGLNDFSGPYSKVVEVSCIYRDKQKMSHVEYLLQNFRSLISRLGKIDIKRMTHEEKLAFWINIHNSLVMHAFLIYGIPQNTVKRMVLLLKAAYNVGGQIVSADVIQSSILGCRMTRPGQWLKLLLPSKTKFKAGDERRAYAIERSEPLVYFTLSCGSHSDPVVRFYTPKRIFQELETAKEDNIRATFAVRKDHKILLPKMIQLFAKEACLSSAGIMEMIQQSLPESLTKRIKKHQLGKSRKDIVWIPHNFTFRYLILKELIK